MDLSQKKCIPCQKGTPKLGPEAAEALRKEVPSWDIQNEKLIKQYKFKNFNQAMAFINRMADIAEMEGHHPDFHVHYNKVEVEIWTHAIDGLSENDFILAAKLDRVSG